MRRALLLLAVVVCLAVTGCSAIYHGPLTAIPTVNDTDAAEIIVIRDLGFKAGIGPIHITLDGATIYALSNGAYLPMRVSAGEHSIVTWIGEWERGRISNRSNFIDLTLNAGDKRYLFVRTNNNPWTIWTIVAEIPQEEGEELLKKSKPAKVDQGPPPQYYDNLRNVEKQANK